MLRLLAVVLAVTAFWCSPSPAASSSSLVPLDDAQAASPMLPAEISRNPAEIFGDYAYVWTLDDSTHVIQYHGDFSLHFGDRRMSSREAVIWMRPARWQGQTYYSYEVFLSRQARVQDSGGTVTSGPVLFVTFNTMDPATLHADVTTSESSRETPLYVEAGQVRESIIPKGISTSRPNGVEIIDMSQRKAAPRPQAKAIVHYNANETVIDEGKKLVTAIGKVYVSQGLVDSGDFLEIRADAAVLFLAEKAKTEEGQAAPLAVKSASSTAPSGKEPFPTERKDKSAAENRSKDGLAGVGLAEGVGQAVSGVYLRGDVVLTRGERMIRAAELYYDFENDRALILDAVMRAMVPSGDLPVYVRAQQVRQLSSTEYVARNAMVSTSEFHTPHVHVGADRIHLTDLTPRDESGRITGMQAGRFRIHDASLNVEGVPIAYWPYAVGDFRQGETAIRNVRTNYSSGFGATVESEWYMANLLGIEPPKGIDSILRLDYFSKRGPGVGTDINYERDTSYGLFKGYYIHDTGTDTLGAFRDEQPDTDNRGRATWRHRELLGHGWELTLEGSYVSDPTFLEEYFRHEFDEGKEQETVAYLKKQQDNWAITTLLKARVLDFQTETEHFPDVALHWAGEPLGDVASYYNESHIGMARYRPDDRRYFDGDWAIDNTRRSDMTYRSETRNEVELPVHLGGFNIVPYATGRGGYWDGSAAGGGRDRMFGSAGVRSGTEVWRLFEGAQSEILDVHGVRHIIRPEATAWMSTSDTDSHQLHPFDQEVEGIDDFYGTSLALRQKWQTKRGLPGGWRVVDWIIFDVELNLFGNEPREPTPVGHFYENRPENSVARNHVRTDFQYRISDTTAILSDSNWDLNDGNMDLFNISYAVERTPRLSYFVGYRRIADTDSDLVGAGANYEISTKYRLAVRSYYDIVRERLDQFDVALIRKFPRWYGAVIFAVDKYDDTFTVGVSAWPEGAPHMTIGNRRFTNLGTSTGIRPEN